MFNIKNNIFLNFTPRQKSNLLSFLKSFVKKNAHLKTEDIIDKFIEDEQYYQNISNIRHEFVLPYLENEEFLRDLKMFVCAVFEELKFKESQKPYIEKQKALLKIQRQKANDYKMSKLKPTKKQLFYYEKVAKAHNISLKDTKNATRLDMKNWIMEIIEPKDKDDEQNIF